MGRDERGSAVVEFVLVSVLVVVIVLALLQLAMALYVRNTLTAAAAEGARFGAVSGRTPDDAAIHTQQLIEMTLPAEFAADITAGTENVAGVPTVVIEVRSALPVLAWLGPNDGIQVRAHAMQESP